MRSMRRARQLATAALCCTGAGRITISKAAPAGTGAVDLLLAFDGEKGAQDMLQRIKPGGVLCCVGTLPGDVSH